MTSPAGSGGDFRNSTPWRRLNAILSDWSATRGFGACIAAAQPNKRIVRFPSMCVDYVPQADFQVLICHWHFSQ